MDHTTPCQLCGQPAPEAEALACGLCCAPHHPDCWEYTGLCSTYGCGGIRAVPFRRDLVPHQVAIHEGSLVEAPLTERVRALALRLGRRHQDMAVTLQAGVVGALGASLTMAVLLGMLVSPAILVSPAFLPILVGYVVGLFSAGLSYGALAPYLAPAQHRAPLRTAALAGGASLAAFLTGGVHGGALFMVTVLGGMTCAGSAAEWLLGPFTHLGRRLGTAATPLRYLVTAATFYLGSLVAVGALGMSLSTGVLGEIGIWTVLAALAAGHTMEVGREEYRKHLAALVEEPGEAGRDDAAGTADGVVLEASGT